MYLPGAAEPELVGHGEHRWETADPARTSSELPAAATVRDVLDDPGIWSAVVAAAVDTGVSPLGEAQAAGRLAAYLDAPASDLARALAPQEFFPGVSAFRHEVDAILGPRPSDTTAASRT